jgi:DNA-binding transcriptional regulator GbsR (MarR family)
VTDIRTDRANQLRGRGDSSRVAQFVEDFAAAFVDSGIPRMPARVFACLIAAEGGRLTAAELSERLRASPAAISGAVRYLAHVKMVTRSREPGSRRDHYLVEHEVFYAAIADRDTLVGRWIDRIDDGIAAVGPGSEPAERLEEMRDFLRFLLSEMAGMLDRWERHKRALHAAPGRADGG